MSDEPIRRCDRRRGLKPVASDALELLKGHLAKRGFAQVELVTRWREIAGAGLAVHCFPQNSSGAGGASTPTLVADDRASLELQHQAPKLIDRINRYFGRDVVNRIKVVAGDIPKPRTRPVPRPYFGRGGATQGVDRGNRRWRIAERPGAAGTMSLAETRKSGISRR
jgi:hypothetical protein